MTLKRLKKALEAHDSEGTLAKINEFLVDRNTEGMQKKRSPSHAPSSLGSKCLRKIYYNYWKVTDRIPVTDKAARIFDTGNFLEEMIVSWCKGIGEHIPYIDPQTNEETEDPQFPISFEEYRVRRGYIDNVGPSQGNLWLHEYKTSKAEKMKNLTSPMADHLIQGGIYLKAFNKALAEGQYKHIGALKDFKKAVGVKYFYINKNTSEVKEFPIREASFSNTYKKLEEKLEEVNKFIDSEELPPKTDDYCFFCPFRLKCQKECNAL